MATQTPDQVHAVAADALIEPAPGARRRRRALRQPPLPLTLPTLLVAGVMLLPLVYLVMRASESDAGVLSLILRERTAMVFRNSVLLSGAVVAAGTVIAVPLAWITTRADIPYRRFWGVVAGLPLVIPSYVGALVVVAAFGPRGLVQGWLEGPFGVERVPSLYGFTGAWITLTLFTYPYIYMSVRASLEGLDPSLEDASLCLGRGRWRTFFGCILPQLRPAIASGGLLAALYTISDFGVVTLLRYDVFTRAIYVQYRSSFDRSAAAALGVVLVLFAVGLVVAEGWVRGRARYHSVGSGTRRTTKLVALGRWKVPALLFSGIIAFLSLGVPLFVLLYWIVRGLSAGEGVGRLPGLIGNSFLAGGLAAVVTTFAALPVAILAVRYRGRLPRMAASISYLGYALPAIVVALAFVYFGSNHAPWIYQTMALLVIAYAVRFLPQAVGAQRLSLLQINPRLEEASRSLGSSPARTVTKITVPLARPGVLTGAALVLLTAMKDLPITLILAPIGFSTLATELWQYTSTGSYGRAAAPAMALVLLSAIPSVWLTTRQRGSEPLNT